MGTKLKTPIMVKKKTVSTKAATKKKSGTARSETSSSKSNRSRRSNPSGGSTPSGRSLEGKAPVNTTPSEETTKTASPYEKVVVADLPMDSWDDDSEMPAGRKWWSKRPKAKKRITVAQVLIIFTVVVVALLVLIGFGAVMLAEKHGWLKQRDARLTTKTTLCRRNHQDASCVYEVASLHQNCTGSFCGLKMWEANLTKYSGTKVRHRLTLQQFGWTSMWPVNNSDFADCGDLKWCRNKECVGADVKPNNWWPGRTAFSDNAKSRPWIQRSLDALPCLKKGTDPETIEAFANIDKWYGKCNESMCSNREAKYIFRVGWFHCDLDPDPVTGVRVDATERCKSTPLKIFVCGNCKNSTVPTARIDVRRYMQDKCKKRIDADLTHGECVVQCGLRGKRKVWHVLADGFPCHGENGMCVMGECYDIFKKGA